MTVAAFLRTSGPGPEPSRPAEISDIVDSHACWSQAMDYCKRELHSAIDSALAADDAGTACVYVEQAIEFTKLINWLHSVHHDTSQQSGAQPDCANAGRALEGMAVRGRAA